MSQKTLANIIKRSERMAAESGATLEMKKNARKLQKMAKIVWEIKYKPSASFKKKTPAKKKK